MDSMDVGAGVRRPEARAQFISAPLELSSSIDLDEADSTVRAHLERVRAFVADRQWDEAVETLRQVMENHGSKVIPLTPTRYLNVTDFCHVQIAALPDDALNLYRQRVDDLARNWYEEGLANRDTGRLSDVVDQLFCSSWGDDALWSLGEMELERGNYGAARYHWQRLIEMPPARVPADTFRAARANPDLPQESAALLDKWYAVDDPQNPTWYELRGDEFLPDDASLAFVRLWKEYHGPHTRLAYPGSTIPAPMFARGSCWFPSWKAHWPARTKSCRHSARCIPRPKAAWRAAPRSMPMR